MAIRYCRLLRNTRSIFFRVESNLKHSEGESYSTDPVMEIYGKFFRAEFLHDRGQSFEVFGKISTPVLHLRSLREYFNINVRLSLRPW